MTTLVIIFTIWLWFCETAALHCVDFSGTMGMFSLKLLAIDFKQGPFFFILCQSSQLLFVVVKIKEQATFLWLLRQSLWRSMSNSIEVICILVKFEISSLFINTGVYQHFWYQKTDRPEELHVLQSPMANQGASMWDICMTSTTLIASATYVIPPQTCTDETLPHHNLHQQRLWQRSLLYSLLIAT